MITMANAYLVISKETNICINTVVLDDASQWTDGSSFVLDGSLYQGGIGYIWDGENLNEPAVSEPTQETQNP